jgi:hypothetical protein
MTIQPINIGNVVNDGLGDDLRSAFQKVNANFSSLDAELSVTGKNIPETVNGEGIFKQKNGLNLEFKKLIAGNNKILLSSTSDTVVISNNTPDAFTKVITESGIASAVPSGTSVSANTVLTMQGGNNISVTAANNVITIDTDLPVTNILRNVDFGPVSNDYDSVVQFNLSASNIDFGTVPIPSRISVDFGTVVAPLI